MFSEKKRTAHTSIVVSHETVCAADFRARRGQYPNHISFYHDEKGITPTAYLCSLLTFKLVHIDSIKSGSS